MDDYDDYDDFGDEDDLDRDFDDDGEDSGSGLSDDDIALDAFMDGQMDSEYAGFPYGGYGITVGDEEKLTDAQRDLYETEYLAGYEDQQIRKQLDGDDDEI